MNIKYSLFLWLTVLCIVIVSLYACNSVQNKKPHNVLVIHSFNKNDSWVEDLNKGIKEAFDDKNLDTQVKEYYLSSELRTEEAKQNEINKLLDSYRSKPLDLIIVADDDCFSSFFATEHPLTHSKPVIFAGIDYVISELIEKHNHGNITGITNEPNFRQTYRLAVQLFGKINSIQIIAEDSYAGRAAINDAKTHLITIPNTVIKEDSLHQDGWEPLELESNDSIYIFVKNINKINGRQLIESMTYQPHSFCIMAKWSDFYSDLPHMGTAPFLMVNNEGFGDGRIGGYMAENYEVGYEAGIMAAKILTGTPVASIPVKAIELKPIFNWQQLQRWNIPIDKLPANSIILNMPMGIRYSNLIIYVLVFSGLFIVFVTVSLIYILNKEKKDKKLAQNLLLNKREELEVTMKSIRESVISIDNNKQIFAMNQAALDSLGLKKDIHEYIGADIFSVFNITLRGNENYLTDIFNSLDKNYLSYQLEKGATIVTSENQSLLIEGTVSSLLTMDNYTGWIISFKDITDEFIKKELHTLAMGDAHVYAWRYNGKKDVFVFEEVFFRETGVYDNGKHTIHSDVFEGMIHPEDYGNWNKQIKHILNRKSDKLTIQIRIYINNKYEWWSFNVTYINNPALSTSFTLFGLCMSIQTFKETEENLRIAKDKAEESDKLKSIFLSNMSHEIRTPLNAIVGFSNLLTSDDNFSAEEKSIFVTTINEKCEILLTLINDILDLSRIESGLPFNPEVCNLTLIIEETLASEKTILSPYVALKKNLPKEPVFINADSLRLRQLIRNLINNSFKFTHDGFIDVGCILSKNKNLIFYVEDSGLGISLKEQKKIFERFYKTDNFSQGGGLGLSICKVIVERMGGEISVQSVHGEGSKFTVVLPYSSVIEASYENE
ncbi:ABC transporter substrate binding protein [Macellibacteroides fermentans]|uniref:histidine kinase n=1 Tax=Parabacteroides chartae TaxID=1037355 RepID=A0A1T5C776_9BACT|nr:ABC transporter substrate binding protein [Parabacteroides chartae]